MPAAPAAVKALFLEAAAIDDPAARAALVNDRCGEDAALRARVNALLAANDRAVAHEGTASFGSADGPDATPTADFPGKDEHVGAILAGKYKLIEAIGEGGMGTVFLAQQTEPVKRAVAVKVIKPGMDSRAVLARFEAERQALAMMDHPNIARVLDGGTTDAGRPFFVMELVKGTPITQFCDERKLTPRQRLELFVPVCQAIQHAHQKGIIHRDIKPSNVLIALYDDRAVPKVIDFGVAKAAGQSLTEHTLMTGFGAVVGTPEYMSPEQANLNNLDVDTRSDVYSLGVLLYELLTGTTPVDRKSLGKAALLEVLRIVREVEARRPSAKLSSSDALPSVAANRGTEPGRLSKLMKGELDWVLLKALEKDRARRYETANGLARDIQRYLADEVVEARPPSAAYRVKKFVRRHKGQVLAASLVLLALLAGMTGMTWGLIEARRQEQIARDETVAKEQARVAEAERVKERDAALGKANDALAREAERAKERDAALKQETERVKERDAALTLEAKRVKERDAALEDVNRQLDTSNFLLARAAYDNRDVPTALRRLGSVRANQHGWEWHYLRRQATGGIFTVSGHQGAVHGVAFSPDGTRIVTEGKVWDARTGAQLLELKGCLGSGAFSPDGTRIVAGGKVWDARTGAELVELKGYLGSGQFSPDGKRIATEGKVWDARTGTPLFDLKGPGGGGWRPSFSPDGTRIVGGNLFWHANVWDARTGTFQLALGLGQHGGPVLNAAFSPDGTRIVTVSGTAKVFDARSGKLLLDLKGHTQGVRSAAYSPDGSRIATGSEDQTAKVWDATTGTPLLDLKGHTGMVLSVAFSPDGRRIVTGSEDRSAKVWDARTGVPQIELKAHDFRFPGQPPAPGLVSCVAFSPDNRHVVTGGEYASPAVWDTFTGKPQLELNLRTVHCVAYSPDGTRIVVGHGYGAETAKVFDARSGKLLLELKGHANVVSGVAYSPDGKRIVTGSPDQTAKVWDATTGTPLLDLKGHKNSVSSVAYSPDSKRIVTGSPDQTAKVWDARSGKLLLELKGHVHGVTSVAYSPDGTRIITSSEDRTAKEWDATTGMPLLDLKGHKDSVNSVAYSPDGKRIVTVSSDQTAKVWDPMTGTPLLDLKGASRGVAFSPDGARIVFGNWSLTTHVKVWDARPSKEVPDEEEIAYRRFHTEPDLQHYREGYHAARAAKHDFAARFYINLLPLIERPVLEAQLACDHKHFAAAAKLLAEAMEGDPKLADDRQGQPRYNAARAAAMAAAGQGQGELPLDDKALAKLRRQARDWLKAELTALDKLPESDWPPTHPSQWRTDSDLAGIRDAAALAKLPPTEHEQWRALWAEVEACASFVEHFNRGLALAGQGKFDEAGAQYRTAIRRKPDFAEAYCNLGNVLYRRGDYAGAVEMRRKGHELGCRYPHWPYPSAQWVAQAERALTLSKRLPALLRGEDRPADNAERLAFAQIAHLSKNYAAATRLWAEALTADPKLADNPRNGHRYNAACAAAQAAAGQGKDEPPLDNAAKVKLRRQALGWLKADLAAWGKLVASGPPGARPTIVQVLNHWQQDSDLTGIRDKAALAKLPAEEQKAFTQLWGDVAALLKRAEAMAK